MCGIVGGYGKQTLASRNKMLKAIEHRGPDDMGFIIDESTSFFLGHTRLSIIELSELGHQPIWDSSGRYVLAFNGEI